jgi:hypothetical protein
MNSSAAELWNAWRESAEIRELAEAWITKPTGQWTDDDERLHELFGDAPDRSLAAPDCALATIFAIMQLTDDPNIHGGLAAGPFEDFLGKHGEAYLDAIHTLALEHRRLREVLEGVWQGSMPKRVWRKIEMLKQSAFS